MHSDTLRTEQIMEHIARDPEETHTFSCSQDAFKAISRSVSELGLQASQIGLGSDSQVLVKVHR